MTSPSRSLTVHASYPPDRIAVDFTVVSEERIWTVSIVQRPVHGREYLEVKDVVAALEDLVNLIWKEAKGELQA